jgi:hypothetical protein
VAAHAGESSPRQVLPSANSTSLTSTLSVWRLEGHLPQCINDRRSTLRLGSSRVQEGFPSGFALVFPLELQYLISHEPRDLPERVTVWKVSTAQLRHRSAQLTNRVHVMRINVDGDSLKPVSRFYREAGPLY